MDSDGKPLAAIHGIAKRYQLVFPERLLKQMLTVVEDALSFATITNILQHLGVNAQLYQLDFSTLVELESNQFIVYQPDRKMFLLVENINQDAILFYPENQWLSREVFEKSWDGYTLVFELGEEPFSKHKTQNAISPNHFQPPSASELLQGLDFWVNPVSELEDISPIETYLAKPVLTARNSPSTLLGSIAGRHAIQSPTASFEIVLDGPAQYLEIGYSIKHKMDGMLAQYQIPVALPAGKQVLQFHFSKEDEPIFYSYLGLKGRNQGIYNLPI